MIYHLACDTCEQIDGLGLRPDPALHNEHHDVHWPDVLDSFMADHDGHVLSLVSAEAIDLDVPRVGWTPRPRLGPPEPGHAQPSVCPVCQALGSDDAKTLVAWKRTTAGDTFLHCRACGYQWGPGADAERQRMFLRGMGT